MSADSEGRTIISASSIPAHGRAGGHHDVLRAVRELHAIKVLSANRESVLIAVDATHETDQAANETDQAAT